MNGSRTLHLEDIGPVLLQKSTRAKRITMTVRPSLGIRVAVPQRVSYEEAADFVRYKRPWLRKILVTIAKNREQQRPSPSSSRTWTKMRSKQLCENACGTGAGARLHLPRRHDPQPENALGKLLLPQDHQP
jgi:predicted metal-dependent hydrolase